MIKKALKQSLSKTGGVSDVKEYATIDMTAYFFLWYADNSPSSKNLILFVIWSMLKITF